MEFGIWVIPTTMKEFHLMATGMWLSIFIYWLKCVWDVARIKS